MKMIVIALLAGSIITSLTWFIEYEYCMDGEARGLPLAMKRPSCGPSLFRIHLDPKEKNGQIIVIEAIPINILIWAGCLILIAKIRQRIIRTRDRDTTQTAEPPSPGDAEASAPEK